MNICQKHGPCRCARRPPAARRAPLSICRFSRFSLDWAGNLNPRCMAELSTDRGSWPVDNFDFYPQAKSLILCDYRNPRSCLQLHDLFTEKQEKIPRRNYVRTLDTDPRTSAHDPPATIPDPPLSIRSARFWTNSQEFTGRTKTRHAPPLSIRWHRSPIRTRWTITDGQLYAPHGSRYV